MTVPAITEKTHQAQVEQLARLLHWRVYHVYDSRRSEPGFPDLVMARGERLIFAELKTDKGKVAPAQWLWLNALMLTPAEVYLWRPRDWETIQEVLA